MRLSLLAMLAAGVLAATPVFAQQISPMTGTTSGAPAVPPAAGTTSAAPSGGTSGTGTSGHHRARHHRQTQQQRFDAANTSHDGKLTLEQAQAGHMTRVAQNFDAIDSGKKGYVTMDDIHAWNRAQRAARKAAK